MIAYLIKYNAGKEEFPVVHFRSTRELQLVEADVQPLQNQKINSQKRLADEERKKDEKKGIPLVREISQTEMDWVNLDLEYKLVTAKFIHIQTFEAAERTTIVKRQEFRPRSDGIQDIKALAIRDYEPGVGGFNPITDYQRRFTLNQEILIRDISSGKFSLDKVTAFSVRPPELRCVGNPKEYFLCFEFRPFRAGKLKKLPSSPLSACPWVDGAGRQVRVGQNQLRKTLLPCVRAARDRNRPGGIRLPQTTLRPEV